MEIKVYTTPTCGYCKQVKQFLRERGNSFTEYDVSRDQAAAQEMMNLTGQMGVPVIVVDGQVVIGFDRPRLESLLGRGGGGNGRHPKFGLKVADASSMARKDGAIPVFGAFVGSVKPASPAERAGIRPGDIITEFNLRPVTGAGDLEKALGGISMGGRVTISLLRGEKTLNVEVVM